VDSDFKVGFDFDCFEEDFELFVGEMGGCTDRLLFGGGFLEIAGCWVVVLLKKAV
jgi:hypothetical protein